MSFNTLLLHCLTSKTSLGEAGSSVHLQLQAGETVLFFDIGKQAAAGSPLRKDWKIADTEPLCDGIVFYLSQQANQPPRKIICLVELKNKSGVEHAIEQVINTRRIIEKDAKDTLQGLMCGDYWRDLEWKAYVYVRANAPTDVKKSLTKLEQAGFPKRSQDYEFTHNSDLGSLLRNKPSDKSNKKSRK